MSKKKNKKRDLLFPEDKSKDKQNESRENFLTQKRNKNNIIKRN